MQYAGPVLTVNGLAALSAALSYKIGVQRRPVHGSNGSRRTVRYDAARRLDLL